MYSSYLELNELIGFSDVASPNLKSSTINKAQMSKAISSQWKNSHTEAETADASKAADCHNLTNTRF